MYGTKNSKRERMGSQKNVMKKKSMFTPHTYLLGQKGKFGFIPFAFVM